MAGKLTLAALIALLPKILPKFLFNRALYKMTGRKALVLASIAVMLGVTLWFSPATADDRPAGVPDIARWARVDRVSDGDTIVLMDRTRIRLHGIDAPERDQPYGDIATAALKYMVGRSVYYVETDTDRYGRMVANLYHSKDGYDINASMVCAGYAWWYERYAPDSRWLEECQEEAQQAPKGLWVDDDPMPPWEWRRR
jgi:endonuclease YncB( thermonuclease family)